MSRIQGIIAKIRADLDALDSAEMNDFDAADRVMAVLENAVGLIGKRYDPPLLKALKADDDPAFDRFASRLKNALEAQQSYLSSLSDLFMADASDIISKKIAASQARINEILEDERMIFCHASALFEKEAELKNREERLDALLAQKAELEAARKHLSEQDADALSREVAALTEANRKLEAEIAPLREKQERLRAEQDDLQKAMQHLTSDIKDLEDAYGTRAAKISRQIPRWIEVLKTRADDRESKKQGYVQKLEQEARRLKTVENRLQERLQEMDQVIDAAETTAEILRIHFEANRHLGRRFSKSLPQRKEEMETLQAEIEDRLRGFDDLLKEMQARLEEISAERAEISI